MCFTTGSAVDTKEDFFSTLEKKGIQFICMP